MGNSCCSEGGQTKHEELKNYESRPKLNQSPMNLEYGEQDQNILLAYTSTDKKKIVKIQSTYRGHATRKRIDDQSNFVNSNNLVNVHNMKISEDEESAVYSGQMIKDTDIKQGFGIMRWPDGTVYEGLWMNNLYNGRGKLYHASGDLYEGEFVDDMAQGFGIYRHANGSKYVGYWNQDKQHGFGKEKWNDVSMY